MKLRHYETMYLLHPDLSDEDRSAIQEKYRKIISDHNGQVALVDPWPLRKLAYKVRKQPQGYYVVMEYGATPDTISELTRNMRIDEQVLKFMTIQKNMNFDPDAVAKTAEKAPEEAAEQAPEETQAEAQSEE